MVVSIDYRLSPETPFPGGLNDCENAVDYFFSVAKEKYDVDTSKVLFFFSVLLIVFFFRSLSLEILLEEI